MHPVLVDKAPPSMAATAQTAFSLPLSMFTSTKRMSEMPVPTDRCNFARGLVTLRHQRHFRYLVAPTASMPRRTRTRRRLTNTTRAIAVALLGTVVTACNPGPPAGSSTSLPAPGPSAAASTHSSGSTPLSPAESSTAAPPVSLVNSAVLFDSNVDCSVLLDSLNTVLPVRLDIIDANTQGGPPPRTCVYRQAKNPGNRYVLLQVTRGTLASEYQASLADFSSGSFIDLTPRTGFASGVVVPSGSTGGGYAFVFSWNAGFLVFGSVFDEVLTDSGYAALLKVLTPHT